ncbi:MAG: S-layer homology domain-containing protein [Firmicutes bacterium]|nr:S-layer homology domain-containing protein [Bacillota bacterium]
MKKLLSVMLVLSMILASSAAVFAAGYSDIKNSPAKAAIEKLTGLGVLEGYGDGTFRPEKNVTRAEMVKTILAALKVKVEEKTANTQFEDVDAGMWYASYIKTAVAKGIVEGKTPTVFDPNGDVTCDQAITMVVRAMGFSESKLKGSYPDCFTDKADSLGILTGVHKGASAASREEVAQLVCNMLDWAEQNESLEGITAIPSSEYAVYLGYSEIADHKYKLSVMQKGRTLQYVSSDDVFADAQHDMLYKMSFKNSEVKSVSAFAENPAKGLYSMELIPEETALSVDREAGLLQLADGSYTAVSGNLVVYVYDGKDDSWTVKGLSYLNGIKASEKNAIERICLFDTVEETKPFEEYNYAIVLKNMPEDED